MTALKLLVGLGLPWFACFLLVRRIEAGDAPGAPPHWLRQLGMSLFLACAALAAVLYLQLRLLGGVGVWTPLLLSLIAALVALRPPRSRPAASPPEPAMGGGIGVLAPLLAAVLLAHLALAATELLTRPLFPWDAWTSWAYRARVWFHHDALVPLVSPLQWLTDAESPPYNASGYNYPPLLPLVTLWTASLLGGWDDTLVNTPTLLVGPALAAGFYGLCRESGSGRGTALAGTLLLLSLPLLDAHLALAGMADVWMTGFAGLGIASLLAGLANREREPVVRGLLLCALGVAVKLEGILWLLLAAATLALSARPWLVAGGLGAVLASAALAFALQPGTLALGPLGSIGVAGDSFYLPLLGRFALQPTPVLDDYLREFLLRGSWHLLWPLLAIAAAALLHPRLRDLRRPLLGFLLLFGLLQLAIFGLTDRGRWAEDATALNRLPLQLTPALVLCLVLPAARWQGRSETASGPARFGALAAGSAAAALLAAGLGLWLVLQQPPGVRLQQSFAPADFEAVAGAGVAANGRLNITGYSNNLAVISSGAVDLDADRLRLLRLHTSGDNRRQLGFFWRAGPTGEVSQLTIEEAGRHLIDLTRQPDWRGPIVEIGLVFYRDGDRRAALHELSLDSGSPAAALALIWHQWTDRERWSQASLNWIAGGSREQRLALPLLISAWVLLGALLYAVWQRRRGSGAVLLSLAVVGWLLLDLRWLVSLYREAAAGLATRPAAGAPPHLAIGDDRAVAEAVAAIGPMLGGEAASLLVATTVPGMAFQALRAKYHLLPNPAYAHTGSLTTLPTRPVDYLLVLRPSSLAPGARPVDGEHLAQLAGSRLGRPAELVWDSPAAALIRFPAQAQPGP